MSPSPAISFENLSAFSNRTTGQLPITFHQRPPHSFSFADMKDDNAEAALIQMEAGSAQGRRDVAGSFLIYALTFAADVIFLAPLILDQVILTVPLDAMGIVVGQNGWPVSAWLEDAKVNTAVGDENHRSQLGNLAGQTLREIFAPIEKNLSVRSRLPVRHLHHYVVDALAGQLLDIERIHAADKDSLLPALLETLDPNARPPVRILKVERDGKPDLNSVAWRTCCLSYKLEVDHLCPSCPRYPSDNEKRDAILRWHTENVEKEN